MRLQTLPHKNLIISATIALGIFFTGFFLVEKHGMSYTNEQAAVTAASPEVIPGPANIDTDGDGLPDWKERLLGGNIRNPDTDGDGTNDGDEVRLGRNPTLPNTAGAENPPSDKLHYLQDPNFATSSSDMLGMKKEFFAKYLALGSQNIKETTFHDLIKKVDTKSFVPKNELVNLNISSDNSAEGVKAYVNAFGVVIEKYLSHRIHQGEDTLIKDAITQKNAETQADLQLLAIMYKNFSSDLLLLRVPSTFAKAHLLIVNGYQGMGNGLLGLATITGNPMNGTAGYEAYLKYRLDVINGYAFVVSTVGNKGISFTVDEPGYPFYWNIIADKAWSKK